MPSPDSPSGGGLRRGLEQAARVAALVLLVWLLARAMGTDTPDRIEMVAAGRLSGALPRWSTTAPPSRIRLRVDADLSPVARDWLAALRGAGARISWENGGVLPTAATAEATADPAGATRVLVAAPKGSLLRLSDAYGSLDSVVAGSIGASFVARSAPPAVVVRSGRFAVRSAVPDTLVLGRVMVFGQVGWESKFVIAALEERGWRVDARLVLSPKGNVAQGAPPALDTARYAAVIVLDSAGVRSGPAVVSYVRSGGGAILGPAGARAPGLGGLGAVAFERSVPGTEPFDTIAVPPRLSLGLAPIEPAPDLVALERRGNQTAVAARRLGRGRVVILGYDDSWRWRMAGGREAPEQHRTWWADLVSQVAFTRRVPIPPPTSVDEAPLVHLIETLGPASPAPPAGGPGRRVPDGWMFGLLLLLLLLEWGSRRLRGDS